MSTTITDLIPLAKAVSTSLDGGVLISARAAARCLSGVMSLVARQASVLEMQRACALLVRTPEVWSSRFSVLPKETDGRVAWAVEHIAVVARGILASSGDDSMRAALSFWAIENDPAEWQKIASIASLAA